MKIGCNFGDAEKIRNMLKNLYPISDFSVIETRHSLSSLNRIEIYDKGELIIALVPSMSGYTIDFKRNHQPLDFIGDIYDSLK